MEPPPISAILFFALLFFLTPSFISRPSDFDDVISREERQLSILKNSSYGTPGNLTGLQHVGHHDKNGQLIMMPPQPVRTRAKQMVKDILGSDYELAHPDWDDKPKPAHQVPDNSQDGNDGRPLDMKKREFQDGKFPFWHNITSIKLHGPWSRETLPSLPPYLLLNDTLDRNITTESGMVSFSVDEFGDGPVQDVKLNMMIMDPHDTKLFDARLQGIHFVSTGDLVLTSTSDRFAGIFGLPHFTLSQSAFNASKASVVASITATLEKQKNTGMTVPSWQSTAESSVTPNSACDFIAYLQIHQVREPDNGSWYDLLPGPLRWLFPWADTAPPSKKEPYTPEEIALIESELRHKTGVPTRPVPPIEVSGVVYSPTCGYVLGVGKAKGLKEEVYFRNVALFALLVGAASFWQIWGLIAQMKESSTPSTVSRVSIWSVWLLGLLDGYLACAFLGVGIVIESAFLPIMTAGFLTFIGSMVFGARFIYTIYQVQRPPRGSSTTPAPRAAPTTLPAPVTAPNQTPAPAPARTSIFSSIYPTSPANQPPRSPTPIIIAPDQDAPLEQEAEQAATTQQQGGTTTPEPDGRQDALLLLSRSLLALFTTSFLFLHATSWSYPYRTYFFRFTVTVLSSVWWPQVFRNVSRNARVGLSMRFVLSQSVARVGTFAGAMVLLGSVMGDGVAGTDWYIVLWVVCWVGLQVLVLWSQGILGGRWFLPSVVEKWGWVKGGFDYHCVLKKEDLELLGGVENVEDGAETGSVRSGHRRKEGGRCWFDCAICREPVGVPFLDDEDDFSDEERPRDEEEGGASDSLLAPSSSSSSASRARRGRGWRRWFRIFSRKGRKRDDNGGSSGGGGGVKERLGLQRKDYMVTPCRHVFHTDCLEGWMRYRLQCPICRCALPAL